MKDLDNAYGSDAREKFDMVFTNPPFGAKVKVEQENCKPIPSFQI